MPYGDYNGFDKPDKGKENGSCNRTFCQAPQAIWWNHGSNSWYCADCKRDLERANAHDWDVNLRPYYNHPMFETRAMIEARKERENEIKQG